MTSHVSTSRAKAHLKIPDRPTFDPSVEVEPFYPDDPCSGPGFPEEAQEAVRQHFRPSEHGLVEMNLAEPDPMTGERDFRTGIRYQQFTLENLRTHRYVHLSGGASKGGTPRIGPRYCCIVVDLDNPSSLVLLEQLCRLGCSPNLIGFRTTGPPEKIGRAQAIWLINPVMVYVLQGSKVPKRNVAAERYLRAVRAVLAGLLGDQAFSHHQSRSPWYSGADAEYTWHLLHLGVYKLQGIQKGLEALTEKTFYELAGQYVRRHGTETELPLDLHEDLLLSQERKENKSWMAGRVDSRGTKQKFRPFIYDDGGSLQRNTWIMEALGERMRSRYRSTSRVPSLTWALEIAEECNAVLAKQEKGPLEPGEVQQIAESIHRSFDPSKVRMHRTGGEKWTQEQRSFAGKKSTRVHPEIFEQGRQKGRDTKSAKDLIKAVERKGALRKLIEQGTPEKPSALARESGIPLRTVSRLLKEIREERRNQIAPD